MGEVETFEVSSDSLDEGFDRSGLSIRALNGLDRAEIRTLRDLSAWSLSRLVGGVPGLGQVTANEIAAYAASRGVVMEGWRPEYPAHRKPGPLSCAIEASASSRGKILAKAIDQAENGDAAARSWLTEIGYLGRFNRQSQRFA